MSDTVAMRQGLAGLAVALLALFVVPSAAQPPQFSPLSPPSPPSKRYIREGRGHFIGSSASEPGASLSQLSAEDSVSSPQKIASYSVKIVKDIPHQDSPWTQGLEYTDDGYLLETSGNYPRGVGSAIRKIDPATGAVAKSVAVPGTDGELFLEGITQLGNRFYASTYGDHKVLQLDQDLNTLGSSNYPATGWGFAHTLDRTAFLGTDGSDKVMKFDPKTFEILETKHVTCLGKNVAGLNELEMVDDFQGKGPALLGNLINTRLVLVLDPNTFECRGTFHLRGLEEQDPREPMGLHVANGIAYNKVTGTFFVTGKNWKRIYEIELSEEPEEGPEEVGRGTASQMLESLLQGGAGAVV